MTDRNKNRPGYKKTSLGWIPEAWKHVPLDHAAFIQTGLAKSQKTVRDPVDIPYLRVANVQDGYLDLTHIKTIPVDREKAARYALQSGDVLMTEGGDFDKLGRGTVWQGQLPQCLHQNHVFAVRPDSAILLSDFLSLQTGSAYGKKYFLSCSKQSTNLASINSTQLKAFPLLLPPLQEQKAIAEVLSVWDQAIEKTERLIRAKEQRLEAYGQDIFKRNKIGKSNGWKLIKVADVLHEHGDKSTGVEEVYSVSVHKGLINQVEHLGRSFSAANTDHYNRVHHGDIVYTKSPTGDFPLGIVKQSYSHKDVIVSPLYGVFTPQNYFLGVVIDFYFSSPTQTKNYLAPIIQKGAKNTIAITNKTFLSAKLHLPVEPSIQRTIAEYVETARKEIDLLKKLAEKQTLQKRGLMHKLLTGEWRVKMDVVKTSEETKS
jgi:type I restriction enzyme S subunit